MPSKTWTPGTVIDSVWLQEVDDFVFGGSPTPGGGGGGGVDITATPETFPGLDPTGNTSPAAVTANTQALQAFFDACRGKRGYLPAGRYKTNATLTMDPVFTYSIEGAGWNSENGTPVGTSIETIGDHDCIRIYYANADAPGGPAGQIPPLPNSDNRVRLARLALRGPGTPTPPGTQTISFEGTPTVFPKGHGILGYWVQGLQLEDVWISQFQRNGMYLYRCFSTVFDDVWVIKNNFSGVVFYKTGNAVELNGLKALVNGRIRNNAPHYNIIFDADSSNFANLGIEISGSSDVSYCGQDGPFFYSRAAGKLINITVSGGVATATGVGFAFQPGDVIGVTGCLTDINLNNKYPVTLLTANATTLTWNTTAANGTYTDAGLALGPYGVGIGLNHVFGANISAYCEDPSGVGMYLGNNVKGCNIKGGYWQDATILVDTGARGVTIEGAHFAGLKAGPYIAEAVSTSLRQNQYFNLPGRGLARLFIDGLQVTDFGGDFVQGHSFTTGKDNQPTNLGLGYRTLTNIDSAPVGEGRFNTAVGYEAGVANTRGYGNTYVGFNAGKGVTIGFGNIALGTNNLDNWPNAQNVVAIGNNAGNGVLSGGFDVYIGFGAGLRQTPGASNGRNVFIGQFAGACANAADIGTSVIIGGENTSGGTLPNGVSNYVGLGYGTGAYAAVNRFQAGNLSISSARVQVPWTITSDAAFKQNVLDIPNSLGLTFVNSLRPVSYLRLNKDELDNDVNLTEFHPTLNPSGRKREFGFIAQEVLSAVNTRNIASSLVELDTSSGYYGLRLTDFVPILVKAVQELTAEVNALKTRVSALENV